MGPRIRSLSVSGFRSYAVPAQTLKLPGDIAAIWGPNSKGKTSLAEAFEFLLTGRISRRELMASSQDEFADALRNAHVAEDTEVYVAGTIIAGDGNPHEVKRVLTGDYGKRQDCNSRLEIDGAAATEEDLATLGIKLSQPPLRAPVLAQHTLAHIFSVRPQDRSTYFKSLLEVADLDQLRNDIAVHAEDLRPPDNRLLATFDTTAAMPVFKETLQVLASTLPDQSTFSALISDGAAALIASVGEEPPKTLDERLAVLEGILSERRNQAFPVREFQRQELADWSLPREDVWTNFQTYIAERDKIDEETRQLTALFSEALRLPVITKIVQPTECPLCGTKSALTAERVALIRQHVEDTRGFNAARTSVKSALLQLSSSATALVSASTTALPQYLKTSPIKRRKAGFTVSGIREILNDRSLELIDAWLANVRPLVRAATNLRSAAQMTATLAQQQAADLAHLDPEALKLNFATLADLYREYVAVIEAYRPATDALVAALNEALDTKADTVGWQDYIDIARQRAAMRTALIDRTARAVVNKELDAALKEIDRAKEKVLDDKFSEYSGLVEKWWEWLRPDESTFFSAVQPRKGARRTIDFKAGLSPHPDRSAPKVRDVIAVFSQSQLHCLGLALFLARAEHEGQGFVVLDDPVLSSDEDYRIHFNTTVLSALLDLPMQVIILTQDHASWEEIETRYRHLGISTAQLFVERPAEGTIIENTSDALLAKISRARSLARGGHPDLRKECGIQLRDAGERFCKEMLIKDRLSRGEAAASLTDYDGKTLGWLVPRVEPLLDHDPSHPGKLEAFKNTVNNACHDNSPPSTAAMTQACGEIDFLQKEYFRR